MRGCGDEGRRVGEGGEIDVSYLNRYTNKVTSISHCNEKTTPRNTTLNNESLRHFAGIDR
jgi:hypothetical protein